MVDLQNVSASDLQDALEEVEEKKPTLRLTAAIAYKNGVTQTQIGAWYGVERKTVYNWLTRFESGPESLAEAATDGERVGRPRRLTGDQLAELEQNLRESPSETGYEAPTWTPSLVQQLVEERWGVTYSIRSCRRMLDEAEPTD